MGAPFDAGGVLHVRNNDVGVTRDVVGGEAIGEGATAAIYINDNLMTYCQQNSIRMRRR